MRGGPGQVAVDPLQHRHHRLRLRRSVHSTQRSDGMAQRHRMLRVHRQRLDRGRQCRAVAAGQQVARGLPGAPDEPPRVRGAEPHRRLELRQRLVWTIEETQHETQVRRAAAWLGLRVTACCRCCAASCACAVFWHTVPSAKLAAGSRGAIDTARRPGASAFCSAAPLSGSQPTLAACVSTSASVVSACTLPGSAESARSSAARAKALFSRSNLQWCQTASWTVSYPFGLVDRAAATRSCSSSAGSGCVPSSPVGGQIIMLESKRGRTRRVADARLPTFLASPLPDHIKTGVAAAVEDLTTMRATDPDAVIPPDMVVDMIALLDVPRIVVVDLLHVLCMACRTCRRIRGDIWAHCCGTSGRPQVGPPSPADFPPDHRIHLFGAFYWCGIEAWAARAPQFYRSQGASGSSRTTRSTLSRPSPRPIRRRRSPR